MGTHYNCSETSGYGTSDNSIKAIHTRSGHILKFTEDESIILTDKSGNEMIFDTVGSNITVTAPETMTFNCKNMNINVGENMMTSVGMNQTNTVGMNQTESVGMMKNISVGANFMTNVIGKVVEFIQGNKESKIEKDKQTVINGKGSTQSTENHELHSQKEIQHNSGEKSKSH